MVDKVVQCGEYEWSLTPHAPDGLAENAGHEIARHMTKLSCHDMKTMKDRAIVARVESGYSVQW